MDLQLPTEVVELDGVQVTPETQVLVKEATQPTIIEPLGLKQKELMNDSQVVQFANQIDVKDPVTLMELGKKPSAEISSVSTQILNTLSVADVIGSTKIMDTLTKIMDQFDMDSVKKEPKKGFLGFLSKKFDAIEKLLAKYQSLGGEIDAVAVELKKYETDIKKSIQDLKKLSEANMKYSSDLDGYIAAGYILKNKLANEMIPDLQSKVNNGDQMAAIDLGRYEAALDAIDKRVYDLESAKGVALITSPQIDLMQKNNALLLTQINSAFVIAIPQFKMAMIQAINLKKQKNINEGMEAFNKHTNELIRRNAENTAANSVAIAQSSNRPTVSIETIEYAYNTIVQGIENTKAVEEQAKRDRESSRQKLSELETQITQTKVN
jgi:uncharacterized protein YaaN involved in tellurite resistance